MKIIDIAVLFCFIFIAVSISIDIQQRKALEAENLKSYYNEIIYIASEDAANSLAGDTDESQIESVAEGFLSKKIDEHPNLDKSLNHFFQSMYCNLGIEDDLNAQNVLKSYIPLKMVVCGDGVCINAGYERCADTGLLERFDMWYPKIPFTYYDQKTKLVFSFTLNDYIYVFDVSRGIKYEGPAWQVGENYPQAEIFEGTANTFGSEAFKLTRFEKIRRQVIVETVRNNLEYYIPKSLCEESGDYRAFSFNLPYTSDDDWKNTVDSICFMAFLRGIPSGPDRLPTFGFGGSKLGIKKLYYCFGMPYGGGQYHLSTCPLFMSVQIQPDIQYGCFNSKYEAAKEGYHPCKTCKP